MLLHQNPHQCPAVTFSSSYGSQATEPANTWLLQGGLGYFFLKHFINLQPDLPSRASAVLLSEIIFFHGLMSGKENWGEKRAYYPSRTITDFSGLGQDFISCIVHDSGALRALFSKNTACLS